MHPHAYWTAGAFLASCAVVGSLAALTFAALGEWLHDRICPCGVDLEIAK